MEKKRIYVSILFVFLLFGGIGLLLNNQAALGNQNLIQSTNTPQGQDYSNSSTSSISNTNINASIQQTYKDDTSTHYDQSNASFTVPAPTTLNYNTSFTNISVSNLKAENYTEVLRNTSNSSIAVPASIPYITSFTASSDCVLQNASFYLDPGNLNLGNCSIYLYKSVWNTGTNTSVPTSSYNPYQIFGEINVSTSGWITLHNINFFLNNSLTSQNTWYIGLVLATSLTNPNWYYSYDSSQGDNTASYQYSGGWQLMTALGGATTIDLLTKIGLNLNKTSYQPSDINLTINGFPVSDSGLSDNAGFWENSSQFNTGTGTLTFSFDSDWYLYSFNVSNVIINYTKNDFNVDTNFTAQSGSEVFWNSNTTISAFDSQFTNNTINITIPSSWTPLSLKNNTQTITWNSTSSSPPSTIIIISGATATNGNWSLECSSLNLLTNIGTSIGGKAVTSIYSNQSLDIYANFTQAISGVVNLSVYNPESVNNLTVFTRNATVSDSDSVDFGLWDVSQNITTYGNFRIQVTWNDQTNAAIRDTNITIIDVTNMTYTPNSGIEKYDNASAFNITINYTDTLKNAGIINATIGYDLNITGTSSGSGWMTVNETNPDGTYNVTIDPSSYVSSGRYLIPVTINWTYYQQQNFTFVLNVVHAMQVFTQQSNLNVIRGHNATYVISYNETNGTAVTNAVIQPVSINSNFTASYVNYANGLYNISIDTSKIDVGAYNITGNITEIGYQTLNFTFTVNVMKAQTQLTFIAKNNIVPRYTGKNETIQFSVTDTSNAKYITDVPASALTVYNGSNPTSTWNTGNFNWNMWGIGNGTYFANISLSGLDMGYYSVILNVNYAPNYNFSKLAVSFYLQGNITTINMEEINNNAGALLFNEPNGGYGVYQHTGSIQLIFNVSDNDAQNLILTNKAAFKYWVFLDGTTPLPCQFTFDANNNWNIGTISLNDTMATGNYSITLISGMKNYENASKTINLTIIPECNIAIKIISPPQTIVQGQTAHLVFQITYTNGTNVLPLMNAHIVLSTNDTQISSLSGTTNATGYVTFDLTPPTGSYSGLSLIITYDGAEYGVNSGANNFSINILPAPGLPIWILYLILGAAVVIVGAVGIQKGVISPRKRRYRELLMNTSAVFEDAINLQHILIIYKNTGTCVFFKSFGLETIDPDLIAGFLSAAQSFAKESMSADGLSEIKSKDSHLLISDGQSVRVTLVLSKPASQFLRQNISRFVMLFESQYSEALESWKGSLNAFKDAGKLVDEILHTSVILPHEITSDIKTLKSISSVMARNLLKIARGLTTEKRNFFFIAQLVAEAKDKMKKKPPEILLGLNELLDKHVIFPLDLSAVGPQPISQQEMNILKNRVAKLPDLSDEERQSLIQDLADMSAPEREATLTSMQQGRKITSDVSRRMVTTKNFTSQKEAKTEINNLLKAAQKAIKQKNFTEAIQCYETAEVTAAQWKMPADAKKYRDKALDTQMSSFNYKIKNAKNMVPKLRKSGKVDDALNLVQEAYDAASSMFKLGFTDYDKDVKHFNKLLNDIRTENGEKGSTAAPVSKENKESLLKTEKELTKEANKAEKDKDLTAAIIAYSKLYITADKLFKFGVVSATGDIKKYKTKIGELKEKIKKTIEQGSTDLPNEEELQDQNSKLLNIALEAEKAEEVLKALVAYQEIINIYCTLGEPENAVQIMEKTSAIVAKITNISEVLNQLMDSAQKHTDEEAYQNALAEYQYAKGICEAIGDIDTSKKIKKKLSDLSTHFQ